PAHAVACRRAQRGRTHVADAVRPHDHEGTDRGRRPGPARATAADWGGRMSMSDDTPRLPSDPTDWRRSPGGHVLSRGAVIAQVPDERTDPPTYRAMTVGDVLVMQEQAERVEAELREWEKHHCEKRITTRCPACGHQTLFIAHGGHLTCSWLKCPE